MQNRSPVYCTIVPVDLFSMYTCTCIVYNLFPVYNSTCGTCFLCTPVPVLVQLYLWNLFPVFTCTCTCTCTTLPVEPVSCVHLYRFLYNSTCRTCFLCTPPWLFVSFQSKLFLSIDLVTCWFFHSWYFWLFSHLSKFKDKIMLKIYKFCQTFIFLRFNRLELISGLQHRIIDDRMENYGAYILFISK